MTFTQIAPMVAAAAAVWFGLHQSLKSDSRRSWRWWPLGLSVLFLVFSVVAGVVEGPVGFWPEHIRNLWGNQIWFDLLIGVSVALFLLIPRARAVGISPLPWVLATYATGGIGLTLFLFVVLRAETRQGGQPAIH